MASFVHSFSHEPGAYHTQAVRHVIFDPADEGRLLTQSRDTSVKIWSSQTGEHLATLPQMFWGGAAQLCCFSPCGSRILAASPCGNNLALVNASDRSVACCVNGGFSRPPVTAGCFSHDMSRVAAGSHQGEVAFFYAQTLQRLSQLPRAVTSAVQSIAFTTDGTQVVCATESSVEVWGVVSCQLVHTLRADVGAWQVSLSPCGRYAAAGCIVAGRGADIWDVTTGTRELTLMATEPTKIIQSICWLRLDSVVTCTRDGDVQIWSFSVHDRAFSGLPRGAAFNVFGDQQRPGTNPNDMRFVQSLRVAASGRSIACCGGYMNDEGRPGFLRVFTAHTPTPLQRQLGELLRSRRGADVTLACGGTEQQAHALVLALRSTTLQRQLEWGLEQQQQQQQAATGAAGSGGRGGGSLHQRLQVDSAIQPLILEKLLEFLYTEHVDFASAEEAQHLLYAASFYDVPDLFQRCLPVLEERLAVDNVADTLIAADKYGADTAALKLAALRFVKGNATAVMQAPSWQRVPARLMVEFVFFDRTGALPPPPTPPPASPQQ